MNYVAETMMNLAAQTGFAFLKPGNFIMILVALVFLYLAIAKGYEPLLLVPISFGMLLVNLYPSIMEEGGLLHYFYILDEWSILPSLIFLGVGAMTDFGPLIANPKSFLLGAAAQLGIYSAYFLAIFLPFRYPGYRPSPFCNAFSKILFVLYIFRYKKFQKLSPTFIKNWWSHFPLNCQSKFQSLYP